MLYRKLKHSKLTDMDCIEFQTIPTSVVSISREGKLPQNDIVTLIEISNLNFSSPSPRISSQTNPLVSYTSIPLLMLMLLINLCFRLFLPLLSFYYVIYTGIQPNSKPKEFDFALNVPRHTTIIKGGKKSCTKSLVL